MARAAKGFRYAYYLAASSQLGDDVERMSPRAMKVFLQYRLRFIEAQIQRLSGRLGLNVDRTTYRRIQPKEIVAGQHWAVLADLDYLLAARDALRQTIETL